MAWAGGRPVPRGGSRSRPTHRALERGHPSGCRSIASGAAQAQDTVTYLERTHIDRAKQALERVGPLPLPGHPDWLLLADRLAA